MKSPIEIEPDAEGNAKRIENDNDDLYTVFDVKGEPIKAFYDPNEAARLMGLNPWDLLASIDETGEAVTAEGLYCRVC